MIFRKPTQNCSICKWKEENYKSENSYQIVVVGYVCTAQGMEYAERVYNSRNCRKLFKEKLVAPGI